MVSETNKGDEPSDDEARPEFMMMRRLCRRKRLILSNIACFLTSTSVSQNRVVTNVSVSFSRAAKCSKLHLVTLAYAWCLGLMVVLNVQLHRNGYLQH